jgi:hypothetical protein
MLDIDIPTLTLPDVTQRALPTPTKPIDSSNSTLCATLVGLAPRLAIAAAFAGSVEPGIHGDLLP